MSNKPLVNVDTKALDTVAGMPVGTFLAEKHYKTALAQEQANILFPATAFDVVPPMMRPHLQVIVVDPDPKKKDVYPISGSDSEFGLHKVAILRILAAAGFSYRTEKDSESTTDYRRFTATVFGKNAVGAEVSATQSATWLWDDHYEANLSLATRKNYPNPKEWATKRTLEERAYADERTESRALLRAVRQIMALRTAYTKDRLELPFVVGRLVPDLDMSDPVQRQVAAQNALGAANALYPQTPALPTTSTEESHEEEIPDAQFTADTEADPADIDYDPFKKSAQSDEEQIKAELRDTIRSLSKPAAQGGIGGRMKEVIARQGNPDLTTAGVDMLNAIVDDAKAVRDSQEVAA